MAVREDQVAQAVKFLSNEKVQGRPVAEKESFLANKGVTKQEIEEAFRRHEKAQAESSSSAAASPSSEAPAASAAAAAAPPAPAAAAAPPAAGGRYPGSDAGAYQAPAQPSYGGGGYPSAGGGYAGAGGWPQQAPTYAPPYALPPLLPYEKPSSGGGSWWGWLLGGAAAGLGATLLLNPLRGQRQLGPVEFALLSQQQQLLQMNQQQPQQMVPDSGPADVAPGAQAAAVPLGDRASVADTLGEDAEVDEGKVAFEDLVTMLRKQSEEARENSAVFAKALQAQQEQYKSLFAEMQKVLDLQTKQQKPAKPQPLDLTASTIQKLAALISAPGAEGAAAPGQEGSAAGVGPPGAEAGSGLPPATMPAMLPAMPPSMPPAMPPAMAPAAGGPVNGIRESFQAINHNLARLVRESSSKAEVARALSTLAMILQNLLNNPTSERHRKVNASGARFRELLTAQSAGSELLRLAGFEYQSPNYTFPVDPEQGVETPQRVLDLVQEAQRDLDQAWESRQVNQPPPGPDGPAKAAAGAAQDAGGGLAAGAAVVAAAHGGPLMAEASRTARPASSNAGAADGATAPGPWGSAAGSAADAGAGAAEEAAVGPPAGPAAQATVAHPAESQDWAPGPAIAHPAEADGSSPPMQQLPPQQLQQPQQPQMPIAHPAEAGEESEQPQSGG